MKVDGYKTNRASLVYIHSMNILYIVQCTLYMPKFQKQLHIFDNKIGERERASIAVIYLKLHSNFQKW